MIGSDRPSDLPTLRNFSTRGATLSFGPIPAMVAWAALSIGLVVGRSALGVSPTWWLLGAAIFAVVAAALTGRKTIVALALAGVFFGAGFVSWRLAPALDSISAEVAPSARAIVTATGMALEDPQEGPSTPGAWARFLKTPRVSRFTIEADTITDQTGDHPTKGKLRVRVGQTGLEVRAGDRVQVDGFYFSIEPPSNPGQPDGRLWAAQSRIIGRLIASTGNNVQILDAPRSFVSRLVGSGLRLRATLRRRAQGLLDQAMDSDPNEQNNASVSVISALLLGRRQDDSMRELSTAMRRIGVAHLLSISGLHLGIVVWLAVMVLRWVGVRAGVEAIVVAALVLGYVTIVPARTPIVRAAIMALAYLGAEASGRRHHPLAILAWAGVATLLWRPLDLFSPGYQLSFGVVAAVILLPPIVHKRLQPLPVDHDALTLRDRIAHWLEQLFVVALCAWVVATPVVVYHFGVLSLVGVVASVALFPIVATALSIGALTLMVAALAPHAAALLGPALGAIGHSLTALALWLDTIPFSSISLPPVSVWWVIGAEAIAVWMLVGGRWRNKRDAALIGLVLLWLGSFALTGPLDSRDALRIDSFDVDDGACHLVRSGREAILWDAGSRLLWLGERDLPRAVRSLGAWPVRTIVLSHPNLDHYSAIPDLIEPLGVRQVVVGPGTVQSALDDPAGPVAYLLETLKRRHVHLRIVTAGDTQNIGAAELLFLHPSKDDHWNNDNDGSLVGLVVVHTDAGDKRALFTGDIQPPAIAAIYRRHPELAVDIMEAPHHGSAKVEAMRFVREVNPAIVIQSTGPTRANDDRWVIDSVGRTWFTTALDGAVRVEIRRDGSIESSAFKRLEKKRSAGPLSEESGTARDTPR